MVIYNNELRWLRDISFCGDLQNKICQIIDFGKEVWCTRVFRLSVSVGEFPKRTELFKYKYIMFIVIRNSIH